MRDFIKWLKAKHGRGVWLANEMGVTPSAVFKWKTEPVSMDRVFTVSRLTGIPPHKLRPDVKELRNFRNPDVFTGANQ